MLPHLKSSPNSPGEAVAAAAEVAVGAEAAAVVGEAEVLVQESARREATLRRMPQALTPPATESPGVREEDETS